MFNYFLINLIKKKIKRIIKNAPTTKPNTIASNENKLINNSSDEIVYNKKDVKNKIPNKIKFFKTRLIFCLLALTFLLSFFITFFFTINYNKIQSF